jgi:hypothetical protein
MSETEYFRQACKDQVKFTDKVRANKDHEIALLELEIKKLKSKLGKDSRNLGHQLTGIEKRFQEDMINTMGSEFEDDNYNNIF